LPLKRAGKHGRKGKRLGEKVGQKDFSEMQANVGKKGGEGWFLASTQKKQNTLSQKHLQSLSGGEKAQNRGWSGKNVQGAQSILGKKKKKKRIGGRWSQSIEQEKLHICLPKRTTKTGSLSKEKTVAIAVKGKGHENKPPP